MIDINIFKVTFLETNCYLITDKETGDMAVVDPGAKSEKLINTIKNSNNKLKYVLLTHGHFDHICYAKQLADMFCAKVVISEEGADFLIQPSLNLSTFHKEESKDLKPFTADVLLTDNQKIMLGKSEITFIKTPGHTKGCGCYIVDENIFSGDTLFCESFGRTDLFTGDPNKMRNSILRLKNLNGDFKVYPGHGPSTSLNHERKYNPLMSEL